MYVCKNIKCITFLKSEKFWILTYICYQELWIKESKSIINITANHVTTWSQNSILSCWILSNGFLSSQQSTTAVPNHVGTRHWFHGRQFSHGLGMMGMVQAHYIYCALHFYYYYTSSTSDHQALDPGIWRTLQRLLYQILHHWVSLS